jgi:hypothetical protein
MEFLPSTTTMVVWLLRIYTTLNDAFTTTSLVSVKLVNALLNAFNKREYYFLTGYVTPYPRTNVNAHASSSAAVEWIYTIDDNSFKSYRAGEFPVGARLPILSLEIVRDERVAHDLTDFIESIVVIRETNSTAFPTISQIVQAWVLHSQIVFDTRIEFYVKLVTESGDTVILDIDDDRDLREAVQGQPAAKAETIDHIADRAIAACQRAIRSIDDAVAGADDTVATADDTVAGAPKID